MTLIRIWPSSFVNLLIAPLTHQCSNLYAWQLLAQLSAMAPKSKTLAAAHLGTERIPLEEISVADDSGWRELAQGHVAELRATILNGDYGSTTLAKPSLLVDQADKIVLSGVDGCYVINNGKHFVAALQQLAPSFEEARKAAEAACPPGAGNGEPEAACPPEESWPEWCVPELRRVFMEGLLVDLMQYPVDCRLTHAAVQCLSHEQEQNRYRVSTIGDKVRMVKKAYSSSKDWSKAKYSLLEILGQHKISTVQRWITLARDVDEQVLEWIEAHAPTLNQSFVVANKYIVGRGDDARVRLSGKYAIIALTLLMDHLEGKASSISAPVFLNEFCSPLRALEVWEKTQLRAFGMVAQGFAAFHRVVRSHRAGICSGYFLHPGE